MKKSIILLAIALLPAFAIAANTKVALGNVAKALQKAQPGDIITVKDGLYTDVRLKWKAVGQDGKPITVRAEHPGGVVITGQSSLQIAADWLTVEGFHFRDGVPARRALIEFGLEGRFAHHCRLTETVIDNYNAPQRDEQHVYIILSGKENRVDHCSMLRKRNIGVTLIVNLNGADCLDNRHLIDHNYFGPREVYGSNGAETIRIGTSQQSYESSRTTVSDNLFDQCSGEVEVISVKSCDNLVNDNTFWECQGLVVLRHGKRNTVSHNLFVGNGKPNTGGVRIVDEGHKVVDNTFYRLAGKRFFSALAIMDAVPNSLPNRYVQVKDISITGNRFIDCAHLELGTGHDQERTLAPYGIRFTGNELLNDTAHAPFMFIDRDAKIECSGNKMQIAGRSNFEGFTRGKIKQPKIPSREEVGIGKGASWLQQSAAYSDIEAADTVITLKPNRSYMLKKPVVISRAVTLRGDHDTLRYASTESGNMITIADGGKLTVEGLTFDGSLQPGMAQAAAAISTDQKMAGSYKLTVSRCQFTNFGESGCSAIRGLKATFADSISINDCHFADISGTGIDYSWERDDKGRYNVGHLIISGCTFNRFLGIPVNVYRGGNDESTDGPAVSISGCTFTDCCNSERGSVLRLIGPQTLSVGDCSFVDSGRGGATIRLDECRWDAISISGCHFQNSGRIISNYDNYNTL